MMFLRHLALQALMVTFSYLQMAHIFTHYAQTGMQAWITARATTLQIISHTRLQMVMAIHQQQQLILQKSLTR